MSRCGTRTCDDACSLSWQQQHSSPLSLRDVMADPHLCEQGIQYNRNAFQNPGGRTGHEFDEMEQWILGASRPPHAMYVRYTPDMLQLKGGLRGYLDEQQPQATLTLAATDYDSCSCTCTYVLPPSLQPPALTLY